MSRRAWSLPILASVASVAAHATPAHAAELLQGLGGPDGYGTNLVAPSDDGSSASIDVTPAFPNGIHIGTATYMQMFVNVNGNVTFAAANANFAPTMLNGVAVIAPWWADVDTSTGGAPMQNAIYWDVRSGQITVTWHNVGYYAMHDDLHDDFQIVMRPAHNCGSNCTDVDVELRYHTCAWTTGDTGGGANGLGGSPALAGLAGETQFIALPGSGQSNVTALCTTTNAGTPGLWEYTVRGGTAEACGAGVTCGRGGCGCAVPGGAKRDTSAALSAVCVVAIAWSRRRRVHHRGIHRRRSHR
jgi:hypothetical protein